MGWRSIMAMGVLATLSVAPVAWAGAWLQPKGQGLFVAQAGFYSTDRFYAADGQEQPQSTFSKIELTPYVEYGLLENLTIGGTAYIQDAFQSADSNLGIADPQIFARSELWGDDTQHLSLQPLIKFTSAFEHTAPPRGGSRSTDVELSLLYGRSFNLISPRDYLDMRSGYRLRANRLGDQFLTDIALGLGVGEHWLIVPALRQVVSLGTVGGAFSESGDLDYDLTKVELTSLYQLDDAHSVQLSLASHVAGAQTGAGYSITAGFGETF
ncbi:MAG: hypothetical protein ACKVOE_02410 [Rickettsiales bacterium]